MQSTILSNTTTNPLDLIIEKAHLHKAMVEELPPDLIISMLYITFDHYQSSALGVCHQIIDHILENHNIIRDIPLFEKGPLLWVNQVLQNRLQPMDENLGDDLL